jgi:pyruvate/2-oxoglutarate dehydrogenase complex dihydrolipoamide acyltransferase (E2) component
MRELLAMIDAAEEAMEAAERRRDVLMLCADFAARLAAAGKEADVRVERGGLTEVLRLEVVIGPGEAGRSVTVSDDPEPPVAVVDGVELTAPEPPATSCAPAPAPQPSALAAVPKAEHHAAAAPHGGLKTGPFSPGEVGAVRLGLQAGRSAREVAAALNRSVQGVGAVMGKLKRDGQVYQAPVVKYSLTPAAVQPLPPPAPPFREGVSRAEAEIRARLKRIGHTQEWCLGCDAELLEELTRGIKLREFAAREEVPLDWLKERYRKLVPDASYQGQVDVARIAREMAAEAGR